MKLNVAIVYGGYSSEYVISEKSARVVGANLDTEKFNPFLVEISMEGWFVLTNENKIPVQKDDFSFVNALGKKIKFDVVFNAIHGTPGEDGKIQGYLDMLNIPYNNSGVLASSLTFNKQVTTQYCASLGIRVPKSLLVSGSLYDQQRIKKQIIEEIGFPCFVKPNRGGSSFGITKVTSEAQVIPAIDKALNENSEALVEEFIEGTEVTSGVINYKNQLTSLPLTEIVSYGEFFDFAAKYEGASDEITPARISDELTKQIQEISRKLYLELDLKGMIRADYIIKENVPVLIEVNTIPGLTDESLIPQQSVALGISLKELFSDSIEQCLRVKTEKPIKK